jgi:hypothetical protein
VERDDLLFRREPRDIFRHSTEAAFHAGVQAQKAEQAKERAARKAELSDVSAMRRRSTIDIYGQGRNGHEAEDRCLSET